jgi:ABC-type polysaccharide/polyol phosphate transport system ATPase subunit
MQPCIRFEDISKRYRLGRGLPRVQDLFKKRSHDYHWALKDVKFELKPGEALGIIGPNGAGKTTILKILSLVTKPTSGELYVNGRLSALIELGAGFHPDLTGRENIYLNGTILGMRRSEINERFDAIVAFAELADGFLDTPVKRYSSGMYARLGFAIAAHVDPQILVVDEVLAVGDFAFQTKCHARMDELRKKGTALIFVSHNMDAVRRVCDRGLVMYRGQAIFEGTADEAVVEYSDAVRRVARSQNARATQTPPTEGGLTRRILTFEAEIKEVSLLNAARQPITVLESGATATLAIDITFNEDVSQPIFAFFVRTSDGRLIYNTTTKWMNIQTPNFKAGQRSRIEFNLNIPLLQGAYQLGVDIGPQELTHYYDRVERALTFVVKDSSGAQGLVDLAAEVTIRNE